MAFRCYPLPLMFQESVPLPIKKPVKKVLVLARRQSRVSVKKTPLPVLIRFSSRNKIFEDLSKGIVCYRDDSGEITCEGYDEGPRLQHLQKLISSHQRESQIIDLLQRNWLQILDGGGDLNVADNGGDAGDRGFNWNGFNTLN